MIGTTLSHYRIVEQIGAGGMGVVYRAHDEQLDRDLAIKVLPEEVAADSNRLARFEREAKAVAKLDHPNILAIHELGTHQGAPFIVTELLEGETLSEHLQSTGSPLPWRRVKEIGAAVANGLAAAHGKGVIHRDLKPSNVFLCSDGNVKILDFGLAVMEETADGEAETGSVEAVLTREGSVMGTVGYMSPEQVRGKPTDSRSDIFALGCVLYEMLAGRRAFQRDTTPEIMTAILREEPPSYSETGVQVAPEVAKTIQRCLEKNPERRFQSAADLAFALGGVSEVTEGTPVPPETTRRHHWAIPLPAIVGLVIVALAIALGPRIWDRFIGSAEQTPIRSIALLPLENLTGDPEQAYFVDGLHDELIATFAQISGFDKVIARTSVMVFRDSNTPIREIGQQLKVEAVLEGSVRQSGNTVRVTLQLIDASTESHLWADSFERNLTDVLALQSEVAQAVAGEVRLVLTPDEDRRLAGTRTVDAEAYRLYLRGVRLSRWGGVEKGLDQAQALFEQAIELDPTFAEAHVGLSFALYQLAHLYRGPTELMPRAYEEAITAVELNDDLADAHAGLGIIKLWWQWDWTGAESELRRALELKPSNVRASTNLANYLVATGQPENAISVAKRAIELDPLSVRALGGLGWIYYLAGRYDEGIEHMLSTLELHPQDPLAHYDLSINLVGAERFEEAAAEIDRMMQLTPGFRSSPLMLAMLVWTHTLAGRTTEAAEGMESLQKISATRYVAPCSLAIAHFSMGETDRSIEYFEKALGVHDTQLFPTVIAPAIGPLRSDPRFQDILRRMNLPVGSS